MTRPRLFAWPLALLLLLAFPVTAPAQDATIIGTVGGNRVTTLDVEAHLALTGGRRAGETLEEARTRAANELLAGLVVEQLLAISGEVNPRLIAVVNREIRRILLDFHLETNVERFRPTAAEIDAFIAENPQIFGDRATFRINQFVISIPEDRAPLDAALAALQADPVTPASILDFQSRLLDADTVFQRQAVWRSSEQLAADALERLEALHSAGAQVSAEETGDQIELLILLERFADPADPRAQRGQIAQGLVQQTLTPQRDALVAELAGRARRGDEIIRRPLPVDDAAAAGALPPPPEPDYWMFAVVAAAAFFLPLVFWAGRILLRALPEETPWRLPTAALTWAVVLAALASSGWVASRLLPFLGARSFLALSAGGFFMGLLGVAIWARTIWPPESPPLRPAQIRYAALVSLLAAVFLAYAGFRLGLL